MLVARTSGWSARRPTIVIRASVPARTADVVENARAAFEGRERRRRKDDILCGFKVIEVFVGISKSRVWKKVDKGVWIWALFANSWWRAFVTSRSRLPR